MSIINSKNNTSITNRLTVKKGIPSQRQGQEGDLSFYLTPEGLNLYGKALGQWYKIGNASISGYKGSIYNTESSPISGKEQLITKDTDKFCMFDKGVIKYADSIKFKEYLGMRIGDLTDVTYDSGDLTITSLDKIITSGDLYFDVGGDITFDADGGDIIITDASPSSAKPSFTIESTDGGAYGPIVTYKHTTASPQDNDQVYGRYIIGKDDGGNDTYWLQETVNALDVTDGDEISKYVLYIFTDGNTRGGFQLQGQTTDIVNATIGYGLTSITQLAGDLTISGGNITNALTLDSTLTISTIDEVDSDTDKFLMSDSGVVKYVTGANLLTYSGAQPALTFGIANTNAVKIDAADVADDEYARFTANGLESRTLGEIKTDIGTGNSALVPSAGTSGHFLAHNGAFAQVAYSNLSGTPTIPANYVTNDADDTMEGTLTIDKNSTATSTAVIIGQTIDLDHTGVTGAGQTIGSFGLMINADDSSVTHVGAHTITGLQVNAVSNTHGVGTTIGVLIDADGGDNNTGLKINTAGTHILLEANADANDYATIAVADTGDLTIATVGSGTTDSDMLLNADGDIELRAAGGDVKFRAHAYGDPWDGGMELDILNDTVKFSKNQSNAGDISFDLSSSSVAKITTNDSIRFICPGEMEFFTQSYNNILRFKRDVDNSFFYFSAADMTNYNATVAGTIKIEHNSHGITTGLYIRIKGTTDYDGVYYVTKIDDNNIRFTATYTSQQAGACYFDSLTYANNWSGITRFEDRIDCGRRPVTVDSEGAESGDLHYGGIRGHFTFHADSDFKQVDLLTLFDHSWIDGTISDVADTTLTGCLITQHVSSSSVCNIYAPDHGLFPDSVVTISGTTNYNNYEIIKGVPDKDNFTITQTYVSDQTGSVTVHRIAFTTPEDNIMRPGDHYTINSWNDSLDEIQAGNGRVIQRIDSKTVIINYKYTGSSLPMPGSLNSSTTRLNCEDFNIPFAVSKEGGIRSNGSKLEFISGGVTMSSRHPDSNNANMVFDADGEIEFKRNGQGQGKWINPIINAMVFG